MERNTGKFVDSLSNGFLGTYGTEDPVCTDTA